MTNINNPNIGVVIITSLLVSAAFVAGFFCGMLAVFL